MRQAGALAEAAGAPPEQVAAALLHDVGHICGGTVSGRELMAGPGNPPRDGGAARLGPGGGAAGAAWLAQRFAPEGREPVRLHVAAKRYLCAVEPGYFSKLSEASVYTLSVQGGPMDRAEAEAFAALPHAAAAVAVRRWDEEAKDPDATTPEFSHFRDLLIRLTAAG